MIIVMTVDAANLEAVKFLNDEFQIYPAMKLNKIKNDSLTLFDLNLDASFSAISPHYLSDELIKSGLPTNIKKINLIVSDISLKNNIMIFAQEMADYLFSRYQRQINIYAISNMNYNATLIIPPKPASKEWAIYGIHGEIVHAKNMDEKDIINYYPNHLLWRGEDIYQWLQQSKQREFKSFLP